MTTLESLCPHAGFRYALFTCPTLTAPSVPLGRSNDLASIQAAGQQKADKLGVRTCIMQWQWCERPWWLPADVASWPEGGYWSAAPYIKRHEASVFEPRSQQ